MRGSDGSPAEMPFVPSTDDWPWPDEATAERLLSGEDVGPDAPPDLQELALVLSAAARPATQRELSGEEEAVAAFMLAVATVPRAKTWARRGAETRVRTFTLARKVPVLAAGGVLAVAVALGGTAAAGGLPAPLQSVAHTVFGAPAPTPPPPSQIRHAQQTGNGQRPVPSAGRSPSAAPAKHAKTKTASSSKTPKTAKTATKTAKASARAGKQAAKAEVQAVKAELKATAAATSARATGKVVATSHHRNCRGKHLRC